MAEDRGPAVRVPAPVMVAAAIVPAWALRKVLPLPVLPPMPGLGNVTLLAGLALAVWALLTLVRAGIDPRPDRPDAALVEGGPFRFSRNPAYLGLLLLAAGLALRWGDLWGWLAVLASQQMLHRPAIAREEPYLAARFGAAYEAYRARVRRWI